MTRVAFKQCDVERLLRAAMAVGLDSPSVEVRPDGSLRLLTDTPAASQAFPPAADDPVAELEAWSKRHGYA